MHAKKNHNLKQMCADLDALSAQDFETGHPTLSSKHSKGLTVEKLEQRISKTFKKSLSSF